MASLSLTTFLWTPLSQKKVMTYVIYNRTVMVQELFKFGKFQSSKDKEEIVVVF